MSDRRSARRARIAEGSVGESDEVSRSRKQNEGQRSEKMLSSLQTSNREWGSGWGQINQSNHAMTESRTASSQKVRNP